MAASLAHGSESLRLEEFDTLLDVSPPPSSVPRHGLSLFHANAALLYVVLQIIFEALSLSPSVMPAFRQLIEQDIHVKLITDTGGVTLCGVSQKVWASIED